MARQGVFHRTIRFENRNGRFRRFDWNTVATHAGAGWEPVRHDMGSRLADCESDGPINRVDKIEFDADFRDPFYRDPVTNQPLIGGFVNLGREFVFDEETV